MVEMHSSRLTRTLGGIKLQFIADHNSLQRSQMAFQGPPDQNQFSENKIKPRVRLLTHNRWRRDLQSRCDLIREAGSFRGWCDVDIPIIVPTRCRSHLHQVQGILETSIGHGSLDVRRQLCPQFCWDILWMETITRVHLCKFEK